MLSRTWGEAPTTTVDPAPATTACKAPTTTVLALIVHARGVPSAAREAFAAECEALAAHDAIILVHTCHRVELYVALGAFGDGALPQLPPGGLRLEDAAAARHLINVACGLQSAVLGEDQILHQVRETYALRHAARPLDPVLDRLFQVALNAGRRAHGWFAGSPRSLGDVALDDLGWGPQVELAGGLRGRLEKLVAESGGEYCRWLRARDFLPAIQAMTEAAEARRLSELAWLSRRLPSLSEEDRALVDQMTHRLVAGILHKPKSALRLDESGELGRAAWELFGLRRTQLASQRSSSPYLAREW